MTEVQALMGLSQLNNLNDFVIYRNKLANAYNKYLQPLVKDGSIRLIKVNHDAMVNAYWRYIVFLINGQNREEIRKRMEGYSIKIDWAYQPLVHLQPVIKKMYGMRDGDLPLSEQLSKTHICLPIHLGISMKGVKYISEKFIETM